MSASSAGESGIPSTKIDRVRSLLSFDFSLLDPAEQTKMPAAFAEDQTTFVLADTSRQGSKPIPNQRLVGFDEAGRGALAGPVAVACVSFELGRFLSPAGDVQHSILETYADLNDSKRVTARARERLYHSIKAGAHWGVGYASAVEIDCLGIVKACCTAAVRAYRRLGLSADLGLFDRGLSLGKEEGCESIPVSTQLTRGDARSFHIAAASILAKVGRDAIMRELGERASVYGFAGHKGYGTAAHFEAIQRHGPSRFHRRTFLRKLNESN